MEPKTRLQVVPDTDMAAAYAERITAHREEDSGFDLMAAETVTIPPGGVHFLKLGVRAALFRVERRPPKHDVYVPPSSWAETLTPTAFWLLPRSSLSKTPLRLANSVGLIDAGYRGELLAAVDNRGAEPYEVVRGTRLFQIAAPDLRPFEIEMVTELPSSVRGEGGFGSTGK